ncbi:Uroporphyrinogen-III decarboxylase [Candidatus Desulfosporosinus infrequens]|uniref:Uroporphyrinogen-III decarboxylase n=1 Tax=Candidatus Desulfosporosinus infrequens TaxID=2043169 RepID=A0A2U3KX89_9FIRM|nr:Uroporphyrinogen-III decarboxylase [Candidatus Desulfosporosinus infrequens]
MNSLERLLTTIQFRKPDRQLVIAPVFGHAAVLENRDLSDYVQKGELLAECQLKALERYHHDAVFAIMDASVETEAAGSVLEYRSNMYPMIKYHVLEDMGTFNKLIIPDPYSAGRMPEQLQAVKRLRQELGNDVAVIGCVVGPMTLTGQLLGLEKSLFLAVDEPEIFEAIMDYATKVIIEFGCAQLKAGAHLIMVFEPTGSPAVIPPSFFREMLVSRLKQIFRSFTTAGSVANFLHIAGPTKPILPYYKEAEVNLANFDYYVGSEEIKSLLPDICLCGNIKSGLFLKPDPAEIKQVAKILVDSFEERRGFILSAGCEIPPEANPKNIEVLVEVARESW